MGSVEPSEIDGKVLLQKDPSLARFCRFNPPLPCMETQRTGRHPQECGSLVQIERAHDSVLIMAVQSHVIATRLQPRLAIRVLVQALGQLPYGVIPIGLERLQELP